MLNLAGYQETDQIYAGTRTLVYRAIQTTTEQSVIIKLLRNPYPSFHDLVRFRNQYIITRNLEHPTIVQPLTLERYQNGYALVMPDEGALSLLEYWQEYSGDLSKFLIIALQLASALHYLGQNHIIHKDIKPSNILIHPETCQIQLIDFSISSLLPKEQQQLVNPKVLEGTIAYISPEQTGRMNRGIDYRTDFYSLGVTLYELLTGILPFDRSEPMELLHCHIAKTPLAPHELLDTHGNPYPEAISDIILKLMAKNAEERYQSALGLKHDLEQCWQQWETTGEITPFELGNNDRSDRFLIPEKLYGRETEVQTLLDTFERVAGGNTEMMLVAGFSGIGKTAVVNEVHKPIVKQQGYFIKGKFDQFNRNIPLSAFVQAFRDLMEQLLSESDTELANWKAKILNALGDNAQVIIDVVPELEGIIGKQSPAPELSGSAAQNRFNLLFQKFIAVFRTKEHPLTLFLDDLQWADSASLNLLKVLMSDRDSDYLLLLGTYRDNEVFPAHPLMLSLAELEKEEALIATITLEPLVFEYVNQLVAETLSCNEELAQPLTELVYQKTQGNPFFTTQFLQGLHKDELITFNLSLGYWECDLVQVHDAALTDDVVEFMAGRLQKLPEATQNVLKLAACIGNQFELQTLAIICEESEQEVAGDIWNALQEGLVLPVSESYKFFQESGINDQQTDAVLASYRFLHDRVQQAAYSLIPETQKKAFHLKIGQLLSKNIQPSTIESRIFDIVNQLNIGRELIVVQSERDHLAKLNWMAGYKAKNSTAYITAREYLAIGLELQDSDCWQQHYDFTLDLHLEAAEVAYLSGDFEQMEQLADEILARVSTPLEALKVYEIKILAYEAQNKALEAIEMTLPFLQNFGIELPREPSQADIVQGMEAVRAGLGETPIEELVALPLMNNPMQMAAIKTLMSLATASYFACPALTPLLISKAVCLSMESGNAVNSPFAYSGYALMLCGFVGDIEAGYQFGQLALALLSKFENKSIAVKTLQTVNIFVIHWRFHLKNTLSDLLKSYQVGLEVGELNFASLSAFNYGCHSYFLGVELQQLIEEMANYSYVIKKLKQNQTLQVNELFRQAAINLTGQTENPTRLLGEVYDERVMVSLHEQANEATALGFFHLNKLILHYLFYEWKSALEHGIKLRQYLEGMIGRFSVPVFHFYHALTLIACYPVKSAIEKDKLLLEVNNHLKKIDVWAQYAPMNFLHKSHLITAEKQRILGEYPAAIELYDLAIAGAKENEYLQEEALTNELAAKFYLDWGKEKIATTYMQEAYYCYACWGAKAKTDQLEEKYPQLLSLILQKQQLQFNPFDSLNSFTKTLTVSRKTKIRNSSSTVSDTFDFVSILQAAQTISSTIELDQLLDNIVQIIMINSGAQKVVLLIPQADQWELRAMAQLREDGAVESNRRSQPLTGDSSVPIRLIQYVKNTREPVLIDEGKTDISGIIEGYLLKYQPQSVLCLPLLNQGQLVAIIYLEHATTKGVFTPHRLTIIQFLCAQAAVSLQNAQLYNQALQDLLDLIDLYQSEYPQSNEIIEAKIEAINLEFIRRIHDERSG